MERDRVLAAEALHNPACFGLGGNIGIKGQGSLPVPVKTNKESKYNQTDGSLLCHFIPIYRFLFYHIKWLPVSTCFPFREVRNEIEIRHYEKGRTHGVAVGVAAGSNSTVKLAVGSKRAVKLRMSWNMVGSLSLFSKISMVTFPPKQNQASRYVHL